MDFLLRHVGVYFLLLMTVSTYNLKEVMNCPGDEKDWTTRAATFHCDSENELSYHCIKNQEDKLIEVCLSRKKISAGKGGCPWIYVERNDSIIFGATNTHCDDLTSCPAFNHTGYFTDQLYKYRGCIRSKHSTTTTVATPPSLKTTESKSSDRLFLEENSNLLEIIPHAFKICFGFIIIIYFVLGILCEKHLNCLQWKISNEGDTDYEMSDTISTKWLDMESDQVTGSRDTGQESEIVCDESSGQTRQNLRFCETCMQEITKSDTSLKTEFDNLSDNFIVSTERGCKWGNYVSKVFVTFKLHMVLTNKIGTLIKPNKTLFTSKKNECEHIHCSKTKHNGERITRGTKRNRQYVSKNQRRETL